MRHENHDWQALIPFNTGIDVKPLGARMQLPANIGFSEAVSRQIALQSTEFLERLRAEPERRHGGFVVDITRRGDDVHITGRLCERKIEVECPYCSEPHWVPVAPGNYSLACNTHINYYSNIGRPFKVIVRRKITGLFVRVHRV